MRAFFLAVSRKGRPVGEYRLARGVTTISNALLVKQFEAITRKTLRKRIETYGLVRPESQG